MLSCPRCPVVKCVRHRGDDVCCSMVFGTLVNHNALFCQEQFGFRTRHSTEIASLQLTDYLI